MRILLALDGSAGAETACELVGNLSWPVPSRIDALRVIAPFFDVFAMPSVEFDATVEDALGAAAVREELVAATHDLVAPTLAVETHVIVGRVASVIVETAERLRSDIIVMGSRGHGPIVSMILGSVSAEVADHAPCPVLIARTPTCTRALVALDGTPVADRIVDTVAEAAYLRDVHLEAISVAPSTAPGPGVMLSGAYGMPITWYEDAVGIARRTLEEGVATAAQRLRSSGLDASWSVYEGDPAATIIEVAKRTGADLVVVGTHGRTGLSRLLLGSVARNVLQHAHASVLVLREPRDVVVADTA
jgi:nucleotide-binding universal stress UspA family protein